MTETSVLTADTALFTRWRDRRDDGAFALLCERHSAVVAATARRLGSPDAEEAAQIVFFVLWQRSAAVTGAGNLVGWLLGVTRRVVANQRRMATRRTHHEHEAAMDQPRTAPAPHQEPAWHEVRHLLDDALAALSARRREAVVRCYLEGKSQGTVAQELGCSVEAVKNRLHEGLAKLRTLLARRGAVLGLAALAAGLATEASAADPVLSLACSHAHSASAMTPRMAIIAHHTQHLIGSELVFRKVVIALALAASCGVAALAWPHAGAAPGPGSPTAVAVAGDQAPRAPVQSVSTWSAGPGPAHAREGQDAILLADGTMLVLGGEGPHHGHVLATYTGPGMIPADPNRPERYDPARQRWTAVAPMLIERMDRTYSATRLGDGRVLVAGGGVDFSSEYRQCELFDPVTGSWAPTAALGRSRAGHCAALLVDGKVLVTGGDGDGHTCELYDPKQGTWSAVPPTSGRPSSLLVLRDGTVLASGGEACERFDPATRTWRATGAMVVPRTAHTATLLADGRVLITGGDAQADHEPLASCELYDPQSGTWTATAAMPRLRLDYAVASLPSGHVLAIAGKFWDKRPGGGIDETLTDSCLEYAPETRSWSDAPALKHARDNITATALRDGRIVVMGGRDLTDSEICGPAPAAAHDGNGVR